MNRTFTTPEPVDLVVEIQTGALALTATATSETVVSVTGIGADQVRVEQDGSTVSVIGPRPEGLLRRAPSLDVTVTVPEGSRVRARTGSADVAARGRFGGIRAKSGSGDVSVDTVADTSVVVTGSGDLRIERADGPVEATSGSGDVHIGVAGGGVRVKVGSGTIAIGESSGDVTASTGSGNITIRTLTAGEARLRTGSGNAWVGVPDGLPVWTDIAAAGGVTSNLTSRGAPAEGQPFAAVRAQVGSGSVHLEQV